MGGIFFDGRKIWAGGAVAPPDQIFNDTPDLRRWGNVIKLWVATDGYWQHADTIMTNLE